VALEAALERIPKTERIAVMLEHDQTGVGTRTTMHRTALCVVLQKGSRTYGIFETTGRAKQEGFSLVTRHPTDPRLFVFVDTRVDPKPAEA